MGNAFWVRHRSLSGFVGPLTLEQLDQAVASGSLPADAEWREARAGGGPEKLDDAGWAPVHVLLGRPAPPERGARSTESPTAVALADLREHSAYRLVRQLAKVVTIVIAFAAIVLLLVPLLVGWRELEHNPVAAVSVVLAVVLYEAGIYLGYQAFLMLADLADGSLRQRLERAAAPAARP